MCAAPNGNVYACVWNGDIYMQTGGSGTFVALGQTALQWFGMAAAPNGNVYASVQNGDIYMQTEIKATTDLTSSTTNASFSYIFTTPAGCISIEIKQMAKANTDVVWFDSFILAPVKYSETVTTGPSKIDVVKLDIPEISTGILTVVINKTPNGNVYASVNYGDIYMQTGGSGAFVSLGQTARNWYGMAAAPNGNVYASVYNGDIYMQTGGSGAFVALGQTARNWYGMAAALERAAIGELIIGKSTYIGDLQYAPSFGIKDWSTITTDVWGNRIIVPRAFSKWLKCPVCVLSTNMDEINRLMSLYRGVNLLWIANPDYSAMIVYGIYTDYSQTWQHLDFTICNLEIEGLT
jgi:hypothetical protein